MLKNVLYQSIVSIFVLTSSASCKHCKEKSKYTNSAHRLCQALRLRNSKNKRQGEKNKAGQPAKDG
ncbi:hypothetical protein KC19_5G167600 [Ceratodon purpureus]|uniref:Secreted protein n=1 Tax=Ceratodon purpureus TaxID=3225 RepID=A0A8T0I2D1_CERPU|nr:hypothetical protein KC19_5G167600 [Ceratodon purpureus]